MQNRLCVGRKAGNWNGIDLIKLLMAVCVVAIHTEPLYGHSGVGYAVYTGVVHCAVPFFFLASGFLLAVKCKTPYTAADNLPVFRAFAAKILRMYLLWSAVYFPFAVFEAITRRQSAARFALDYILKFFLNGAHHNSWQLWYLLSTLYAVLFIALLSRLRVPFGVIFGAGCVLFVLGLWIESLQAREDLSGALLTISRLTGAARLNPFLFRGFFYFPLGMLLARRLLCALVGTALFVLGVAGQCLTDGAFAQIVCVAASVGLFCFAQGIELRANPIFPLLRRMSTSMYLTHMLVFTSLYWVIYREKTFGLPMFLGTTAICVLLSLAWEKIRRKRRGRETE